MSWYNPLSWFTGEAAKNEAEILALIAKGEQDADAVYDWLTSNGPTYLAEINAVMKVVLSVATVTDPRVAAAVTAINVATTLLNALVAAKAANETAWQAAVDAYKAVKTSQANSAAAVLAVTGH